MEGEATQEQGQADPWQQVINEYNGRYTLLESQAFEGVWENFEYFKEIALVFLNRFKKHVKGKDEDIIIEYKNLLLTYNSEYEGRELEGFPQIREGHNKFMKILRQYGIDKVLEIIAPPV